MIFLVVLFVAHWFADFALQTFRMGTQKSVNNRILLEHTLLYTGVMGNVIVACIPLHHANVLVILWTVMFLFMAHTVTDYFTSRWTKRLYAEQKFYGMFNFFSVIGLDQLLHHVQLFICFILLTHDSGHFNTIWF